MSWKDKFKEAERVREGQAPKEEYKGTIYAHYKGMKWWQTFGEGFKILAKTYLPTLAVFAVIGIIFAIIAAFALTEWNWTLTELGAQVNEYIELYGGTQEAFESIWPEYAKDIYNTYRTNYTWNNVVNLFVNYFSLSIGGVLTSKYIIDKAKGKDVTLFGSIKSTFRADRIGVVLLTTLVLAILTAAGFAFYFIFGIVMLIMIGLCVPVLVDSDHGFLNTLNHGFKLGKQYRLRTIMLVIISVLFFSFFGNFLAHLAFPNVSNAVRLSWVDPVTRSWGWIIYVNILNFVTTAVFMPILYAFLAVHYLELTVQKGEEWFDWVPLTKQKPVKLTSKDILINVTVLGTLIVLSLAMTIGFYATSGFTV